MTHHHHHHLILRISTLVATFITFVFTAVALSTPGWVYRNNPPYYFDYHEGIFAWDSKSPTIPLLITALALEFIQMAVLIISLFGKKIARILLSIAVITSVLILLVSLAGMITYTVRCGKEGSSYSYSYVLGWISVGLALVTIVVAGYTAKKSFDTEY